MEKKYEQFWKWFDQNRDRYEGDEISDQSIELIDQKITSLGDVTWEIGPGRIKLLALTISPGGDATLLQQTKEIVSYAPILNDWEFNYAKPVKEWDNFFYLMINGQELGVDISKWKYVIYKTEGYKFDIEVHLFDLPPLLLTEKDEVLYGIVEMVIESILGEETRLERIDELSFIRNPKVKENGSYILHLRQHLETLK